MCPDFGIQGTNAFISNVSKNQGKLLYSIFVGFIDSPWKVLKQLITPVSQNFVDKK